MLAVENVSRRFGATEALKSVSLTVPRAAVLGLLGPNGAGKTTLMRAIMGIVLPDDGRVTWNGAAIDANVRRSFGYMPEERGLYQKLSVRDHIVYFARLHGLEQRSAREAADRLIERLSLSAYSGKPCGTLSKGNQQKVQIASAIAHAPQLIIFDEPFSGLDFENAEALLETLVSLKASGATLILSSHQLWQIERVCDTFAIVRDGSLRAAGTLAALRGQWPLRTVAVSPVTPEVERELRALEPLAVRIGDGTIEVDVARDRDLKGLARRISAIADVHAFGIVEAPLAELYARAIEAP